MLSYTYQTKSKVIEAIILKFDLHCHTKEGSFDSKVPVSEFADKFMRLGFDGFMISDHNSYRGCRAWDKIKHDPKYSGFTVIRGIEYDTKDAGHILVIMPDDLYLPILRIRGMRCRKLINVVHAYGGILGPAHPCGVSTSSAMGFKLMDISLFEEFDFVETFNTCEFPRSNRQACDLAEKYGLVTFAGSDAHVDEYIGMACTTIDADIRCNNDLIEAVLAEAPIHAGGRERGITKKAMRKEHWTGQIGYKIYNRGIAKIRCPHRKYHHYKIKDFIHNHI